MVSITIFVADLDRRITLAKSALPGISALNRRPGGRRTPFLTGVRMTLAGTVAMMRKPAGLGLETGPA
jgi:hypothetical protein